MVVLFLAFCYQLFGLGKVLCGQLALYVYKAFYQRLVFFEHLVVALGDRTCDDKWRTSIVDKYRVDLVDNGVVVCPLHQVFGRVRHVVAQIVETELVVCTKRNVGHVCLAAFGRVGAMLVDAIYRQTVKLVERTHPLGVALGKVIVHRNNVYTVASKRV